MNVPSTTHSLSTQVAPALMQSSFTLAYDVIRRPFTIPELIGPQAAWQIAATILESRSIVRTTRRTSLCRRSRSGPATPPGMITASNSFASRAPTVVDFARIRMLRGVCPFLVPGEGDVRARLEHPVVRDPELEVLVSILREHDDFLPAQRHGPCIASDGQILCGPATSRPTATDMKRHGFDAAVQDAT